MDDETLLAQHTKDKAASTEFKERRFNQWNENYYLYRDKVLTNRLTQRQPVNVPVLRETVQTWISKIDEPPMLTFESRTRDNRSVDGEIVMNELWGYYFDRLKLEQVDNLEKKIVGLQGRGFKKWGFSRNEIFCDVLDPYDIDVSPQVNPLDLESAPYIIHRNIFKPLRSILANPKYEADGKRMLKAYLDTRYGLLRADDSRDEWNRRQERLRTLGAYNFDTFQATDIMVELNESYRLIWSNTEGRFVRHLVVTAMDKAVLYCKPLKEAIGIERVPIITWADDPDLNDFWCDGKADSVRKVNKVINTLISQDIENRAYLNFGMYFFNTNNGNFKPKAFDPKPFGMYGVPGNPDEMVKQMQIQPLGDTASTIEWMKNLIQSSVAQTPTERGVAEAQQQTLGEVKLSLQQSTGRNEVTAKNYRRAWKESGEIFYELLNANARGQMTLYKKGNDGEYRAKTIFPSDWKNPRGYECKVVYKSEKQADDQFALQKAQYIDNDFAQNPLAMIINKRKKLELLGWAPEEIDQVMQVEEQRLQPQPDPNEVLDPEMQAAAEEAELSPIQPDTIEQPL